MCIIVFRSDVKKHLFNPYLYSLFSQELLQRKVLFRSVSESCTFVSDRSSAIRYSVNVAIVTTCSLYLLRPLLVRICTVICKQS